jgi:RND family efflux transporter MFP subunit
MRILFLILFCSYVSAQAIEVNDNSIPVTVQLLSKLLVERELSATAQAISLNSSSIAAENMAVIESIHVDVGQQVKMGQVILELESTDFYLSLKQAQASLTSNQAQINQAQLRLKRAQELIQKKYIADDDLLARVTDLEVLNAEKRRLEIAIEQANRALSKTKIKSPFDGYIVKRFATVGSFVSMGNILFEIVQKDNVEVDADIPEHLVDTLINANKIVFYNAEREYPLTLKTLSPIVETKTRIQKARLEFSQKVKAKIGSSGQLIWQAEKGLLPADLVVTRGAQLGVFIVMDNRAKFIPLPEAEEGRPVAINLSGATSIIVGGRERLQDGDLVLIQ